MSVKVKDVLDALQQMQKSLECSICLELLKDPHSTKCNHQFCGQCIKQVLEKSSKKSKNKWYCPLCKTPVSKRSLTPNPKLNEIIAAVHNLQGAIQEDTGVPIGSPPSQPLRSCSNSGNGHHPASQKCVSHGSDKHSVSEKNQFHVYIDDEDNTDNALESHQSRSVTNTNIRSSLRSSAVTHTIVKNMQSNKAINTKSTRVTRNSRKTAQKKDRQEDSNSRNINDELLRMIDTMSFQPVSENGPACPPGDFILVPKTSESNQDQIAASNQDSCTPRNSASTVNERDLSGKGTAHIASEQQERPTIAEADSSIRASPTAAAVLVNKSSVQCESLGSYQDNEGMVSSTKCDSVLHSSADTMQSVSILPSLDGYEEAPGEIYDHSKEEAACLSKNKVSQGGKGKDLVLSEECGLDGDKQCGALLGGVCNEDQEKDNQQYEDAFCEAVNSNKLVPSESDVVDTRDEPCDEVSDGVSYEGQGKVHLPNEVVSSQVREADIEISTEIPSCIVESQARQCYIVPDVFCQIPNGDNRQLNEYYKSQGDGKSKFIPAGICESEILKEALSEKLNNSPRLPGPAEEMVPFEVASSSIRDVAEQSLDFEGLVSVFNDSSLNNIPQPIQKAESGNENPRLEKSEKEPGCEGRGQVCVQADETMDSSDLCERVKQRQRRRATEMALKTSRHSDSPKNLVEWNTKAKKRSADFANAFEIISRPSPEGSAKKKLKTAKGGSSNTNIPRDSDDGQKTRSHVTAKGGDELGLDSCHLSSDKTELSNEVVPPSVSSSDTCQSNSPLINPMIAHINQTSHCKKRSGTKAKEDRDTPKVEEGDLGDISNHFAPMDDYPVDLVKGEEGDKNDKGRSAHPESPHNEPDTASQTSSPCQNPFVCATASQGSTSKFFIFKREEQKRPRPEGTKGIDSPTRESLSVCRGSQPFDPSEKAWPSCNKRSQSKENVNVDDQFDFEETQEKQKQLTNFSNGDITDGKENNEKQIKRKRSDQVFEADAKTSEKSSQEGQYSSNTPTQSSLDSLEMDAVTPCLFGNDSWRTPDKKARYQRRHSMDSTVDSSKRKTKISRTIDLKRGNRKEKKAGFDETADETDSKRMKILNSSQTTSNNCRFSGEDLSSADQTQGFTPDHDNEGTHSFGTSRSISVLQNLVVPCLEQQIKVDVFHEDFINDCRSEENSTADADSEVNSWVEPRPKKARSEQLLASQKVYVNATTELQRGPSTEKPSNLEHTESEVIPPTPPVKPVSKQVFVSLAQSPSKELRSKSKLQRTDKGMKTQRGNTALKQNTRVSSSSPTLQNNEVGSESREDSVSLLNANLPKKVANAAEDLNDASAPASGNSFSPLQRRLEPSYDSGTTFRPHVPQSDSPKTRLFNSRRQQDESLAHDLDGPPLSQGAINSQGLLRESQMVAFTEERKSKDCRSPTTGRANSTPRSPFRQRVDDIGDSFDWSGTRDKAKDHGAVQASYSTGIEDGVCRGVMFSSLKAKKSHKETQELKSDSIGEAGNSGVNEDDCIVVDENDGDSQNGDHEGDAPFDVDDDDDDDEKGSSDDESLLKPAFLPKASKSEMSEASCKDDVEDNEEDEAAAFSQELIPSENDDEDDDEITSSCKALDSTGASSATFLSEAAASTQKMDVLRQDVEAMEKEMEELRAYLAKTDENREGTNMTIVGDDMDYQEDDQCVEPDMQPSLSPPPPLTPTSIPPMRQLSTPLKDVSRYLEEGRQSSDEESEREDAKLNGSVKGCVIDRHDPCEKSAKKRPLSPSYEGDGLTITAVEHRQEETPSPPRSNRSVNKSQEKDEDKLIVLDERDLVDSRTGSLLLVKRRKITSDLIPRKSPVVSMLFTKTGKNSDKNSQSPQPAVQSKGSSPLVKRSSPFIYSRRRGSCISPIRAQSPPRPEPRDTVPSVSSHDRESLENVTSGSVSRNYVSRGRVSRERVSLEQCHSPDVVLMKVKDVTNTKNVSEIEDRTTPGTEVTSHVSFVATRLNRQQLAEARTLAESCGGKLASEFNSKTSHVVMATDENMQVTRHSYTMKYLLGLALGKWIVSHHWITACRRAKSFVPEADYEVKGDSGLGQGSIPGKARAARTNKEALLFHEFDALCFGGFGSAVTKEQLSQLLKFCGARVCSDVESFKRTVKGRRKVITIDKETRDNVEEIKAVCQQFNTKPVSLEWVTDSIANYKVQDLRDYIVEL